MKKERGKYLEAMSLTNDKNVATYLLAEIKTDILKSFIFYFMALLFIFFPGGYSTLESVHELLSSGFKDSLFISLINFLMIILVIIVFIFVIVKLYDTYLLSLERQKMLKIFDEKKDAYSNQENANMRAGSNPYYKDLYDSASREEALEILKKTEKWENKSLLSSIIILAAALVCTTLFNYFVAALLLIAAVWEILTYLIRSKEYKISQEFFKNRWE
ncbi:hypothetical protein [Methanolapillus millepedarum]|uniref:Uncharacterized protein n=1 Tax=Methanolapillus millepedarum TaxID=3028296 RepID=A0AA96ZUE9_9EURY|nr:hypothetical protein MsAc7_12270 [Methanosarcinaceae archaeon Ac7]